MRVGFKAVLLLGASVFAAQQATAQEVQSDNYDTARQVPAQDDDDVAQGAAGRGLGEIVVTARRRSENLLDTPVAVTAFDAEELERRAIQQVSEIQKSTPSLVYESTTGNSSDARVFIRAVGNANPNYTSDAGVGIYIDGVFYGRSQGALVSNLDIASIEVLRGPQGTLFGRNTIGGAINISTIRPDPTDVGGTFEVSAGRFERVRARAAVNLPLGEKAAIRVAALRDVDDGFSRNLVDGRALDNIDVYAFSGSLRIMPTENLTFDLNAMYSSDRSQGRAFQCVQVAPAPATFGGAFPAACAATNAGGIRRTRSDVKLTGFVDVFAASGILAWDLGPMGAIDNLTLKAIGGYQWNDSVRTIDFDASSLNGIYSIDLDRQNSQVSGEFQILGQALDRKLDFVFGAYIDAERTPGAGSRYTAVFNFLDPFLPVPLNTIQLVKLKNNSRALYTQMTYDFNEVLSVTGGLRYTNDDKGFFLQKAFVRDAAPLVPVPANTFTANGFFGKTFDTFTPMASVQLNAPSSWTGGALDQGMLYFTYSKGFKTGGFNGNGDVASGNLTAYEPEKVTNYEVGMKFSMFDRRFNGAITLYDMRYRDIQLAVQGTSPTTGAPISSIFNAGAATIQGIEAEFQALLADTLRISVSGDYTDARYTRFDDASVPGGSRVNEPLAYIPEYRISGAIENRFAIGDEAAITPRVQVTRTGERFLITDKTTLVREIGRVPAYTLVDAILRLDLNDNLSFEVYGKNIFDKVYLNDALPVGFVVQTYYGQPATYGGTMRFKF